MGVDVLVVGHSHSLKMTETFDGGLIIDPGTVRGQPQIGHGISNCPIN